MKRAGASDTRDIVALIMVDDRFPNTVRLLVVRHGQSVWNAQKRWQGQADPPLSAEGEMQAKAAAVALAGRRFQRIVASDLTRALRTAQVIADQLGGPEVSAVPGLREVDVGQWSGLTRDEIEERWPGLLAARAAGRLETPPNGETLSALTGRVRTAVEQVVDELLARKDPGDSAPLQALLVTHRGPISTLEKSTGRRPARAGNLGGHWFSMDSAHTLRHLEVVELLAERAGGPDEDRAETL